MATIINRQNLSTTDDQDDIFLLAAEGDRLINRGVLSTSGDRANPVRVSADGVSVTNYGSLSASGNGSSGILVGEAVGYFSLITYDNVTITNFGTISTAGTYFDDGLDFAYADGIDAFGNHNTLVNYGTIISTGEFGAGMDALGSDCMVVNYGTIESHYFGMKLDFFDLTETGNTAINYGTIHVTSDNSSFARAMVGWSSDSLVINYGTILVEGVYAPFSAVGLHLAPSDGENYGTILMTAEAERVFGVWLVEEGISFNNYGLIQTTSANSIGIRFPDLPSGTDGGIFTNYGRIEGAGGSVLGSDPDDHVVNRGTLVGDVSLEAGDDTYVAGAKGQLDGVLTLGDGDDMIVFEKKGGKLIVTDFVAGAGTDDVIDVSALGIHSLDELMAHATQSGTDVVLKFTGKDQIVLENVTLGSLHADDFAFTLSLLGVATQSAHVPNGGYLFA